MAVIELTTTAQNSNLLQLDASDGFGIQTITANATGTVSAVEVKTRSVNAPVADIFLEIREYDGIQNPGVDGQVLVATSNLIAASSITTTVDFISFTFAVPFSLTDLAEYSVAFKYTNVTTIDGTNRMVWAGSTSADYADGELWEAPGGVGGPGTTISNSWVSDLGTIDNSLEGWAQSFIAPDTGDLDPVTMTFRKTGSPTGDFRMRLYTHTGGDPDAGTVLATSDAFDIGAFSGNGVDHIFNWLSTPTVSSGNSYWLVVVPSGTSQLVQNIFLGAFEDPLDKMAQSWNQPYAASIHSITVTLQKNGTPTGDIFMDIYTNIGGDPDSGSLVGTSDAFDMTTVTGGGINESDFVFSTPLAISASGYWMVMRAGGGTNLSGANRLVCWGSNTQTTPVGEDFNRYDNSGAGWLDPVGQDWFFKINDSDLFLDGTNNMQMKGTVTNDYADGEWQREDGFGWDAISNRDAAFEITVLGAAPPVQSDPNWDAGVRLFTTELEQNQPLAMDSPVVASVSPGIKNPIG